MSWRGQQGKFFIREIVRADVDAGQIASGPRKAGLPFDQHREIRPHVFDIYSVAYQGGVATVEIHPCAAGVLVAEDDVELPITVQIAEADLDADGDSEVVFGNRGSSPSTSPIARP